MFISLAAGATGGAIAKTSIGNGISYFESRNLFYIKLPFFSAPLDRTKIYFQTHPERRYRIKGAIKFLKLTYKQDGLLYLWRGNTATMARVIPMCAIQFMSHDQYKKLLGVNGGPRTKQ